MAEAASTPASAFGRLRARLAARPDTEHEQGILRVVIIALLFLYLLPDALTHGNVAPLYLISIPLVSAL